MQFKKVAVLFGGTSSERDVSLMSGKAVLAALLNKGVNAYAFDPSERPLTDLIEEGFDAAFIVLHGGMGENGVIQGALEALGIAYTGCGVTASALAMDKYLSKLVWQAIGLPITPYQMLTDDTDFDAVEKRLGLPLFLKPASEGSSVGVLKVKEPKTLAARYHELKDQYGDILVEQFLDGGEYTCPILGEEALPVIRIIPKTDFYDYEAKYIRDDTEYLCPADLTPEEEAYVRDLALTSFQALGGEGWGRVDFMKDAKGQFYLMEVNTVPGMTSHSLVPKAAKEVGITFDDLCYDILTYAAK